MSLCKLCSQREADKKNTHYLTDSIIRTCLNKDGSNIREQGLSKPNKCIYVENEKELLAPESDSATINGIWHFVMLRKLG